MSSPYTYVNGGYSTASTSRTSGGASLTVAAGEGVRFGSPSTGAPLKLAVWRSGSLITVLKVTGVSGDVLTIDGTVDSATDASISPGDNLEASATKGDFDALWTAMDAKAADNAVVHLGVNETVTGVKTFSMPIVGSITGNAATATSATNITGVAAVANGGTGLSTLGTAGQVLAVNSGATALEYQTPASGGSTDLAGASFSVATVGGFGSTVISTTSTTLSLRANGSLGLVYLQMVNEPGAAGVQVIQNSSLPVDLILSNGYASLTTRFESRGAYSYTVLPVESDAEIQYGPVGAPTFVAGMTYCNSYGGLLVDTIAARAYNQQPLALLDVRGDVRLDRQTTVSTAYSVPAVSCVIGVDSTSGAVTATLPSGAPSGRIVIVKDEGGAAGTNNITVAPPSGKTIDGAANAVISTAHGSLTLYADGSDDFYIIGRV